MAIKIDYDGLTQQAATLKNLSAAYEALVGRKSNLSSQMTAGWEGNASKAFLELMEKYIQQGKSLKEILDLMQSYAGDAVNTFQSVDQECANMINNSF